MRYVQWTQLLDNVACLIGRVKFDGILKINHKWLPDLEGYIFDRPDSGALLVDVVYINNDKLLASYLIIPWQNFSIHYSVNSDLISGKYKLLTVTEFDVIYTSEIGNDLSEPENIAISKFDSLFSSAFNQKENSNPIGENILDIPPDVVVDSKTFYKNYVDLIISSAGNISLRGGWGRVVESKMLYLKLLSGDTNISENWIMPAKVITQLNADVENELREIFIVALQNSCEDPGSRKEIFYRALNSLGDLFGIGDSKADFFYNNYRARLQRWLLINDD